MKRKREIDKSYGRTAKRGAMWSVVRQGGHELVAVPTSMVMARLLTPMEFGVAVAATFFVLLAARLTQFGFAAALVRIKELRPEHLSSAFVVSLGMGVVSYLTLFLAAPFIGRFFDSPPAGALVRVAALTFLCSPFASVASAMMTREMHFRHLAVSDWIDAFVGAVATIALALSGWSYWSIVYGNLLGTVVRVIVQLSLSRWRPSFVFSRAALSDLLSYGLGIQTKRLLEYAAGNLDTLVVGRLLDLSSLGFYDKAFSTMNRLVNRLTLGQAPFRIFSIIQEDQQRFQRAYARLILSVTMIGYPALLACIVIAEPLFDVLYGDQWRRAVLPFQLLCVGGMVKLLNAYGSQANEAAGAIWHQARRQAVGTVLVVVGAGVGAFYGGIPGAAAGVSAAAIVLTVAMQALVRRALGLTWGAIVSPQVPAVVCAALLAALLLLSRSLAARYLPQLASWQVLPIYLALGGLFYVGFVLFSPSSRLRDLVDETAGEFLPAGVAGRLRKTRWQR